MVERVFIPVDSMQRPEIPDLEAHKAVYFASGKTVQVIPDGVTATKLIGIKEASAIKAAQILGGQRGSKARAAKYQAQKSKIRFEDAG